MNNGQPEQRAEGSIDLQEHLKLQRELFAAKFEAQEAQIRHERELREAAIREQELARVLAKENVDARLTEMNALRSQINAERGTFMTKEGHERYDGLQVEKFKTITDKVDNIAQRQSRLIGVGAALIAVSGIVGAIIGIVVGHFWK